jgi:hypothetical protein
LLVLSAGTGDLARPSRAQLGSCRWSKIHPAFVSLHPSRHAGREL